MQGISARTMIYVKEHGGKYYVADAKWNRMYESGALADKEPVAGFFDEKDAELFVATKNKGNIVHREGSTRKFRDYEERLSPQEFAASYVYGAEPISLKPAKIPYSPVYKSKEEAIRAAIMEICDKYKIHVDFKGGQANITTVAGEWFFRYNDRPIQLFHKSPQRYSNRPKDAVHNQEMRFYSPVDVLRYIMLHDKERTNRLLNGGE